MPDPRLDSILNGRKCKGYYWDSWAIGMQDHRVDKNVTMLNLLKLISVLYLWVSLKEMHIEAKEQRTMMYIVYPQLVQDVCGCACMSVWMARQWERTWEHTW